MIVRFSPDARRELLDAVEWSLAEGSPALADQLAWAARRATDMLTVVPRIGTPSDRGLRTWPLKRFPYTLVDRVEQDVLTVIAVAHQRRTPGYGRDRQQAFEPCIGLLSA